ncbi:MAG TPA: hypothetical protein DEG17_08955 [Cyanobacteria bacterium UBA11149]|nr:hypothetical protein [Cyanobacteria bacterium UBA11367]HBE57759.1 hypothetical protein [Cyanobacteria bacterium UBA11366]HBR76810.1 hypothetical protein [Cyanobacteria bacterium UBA11159]HBS71382.1 hypothetical protein [Cyanobacteria bacterium UBA11153]HBW88982.1 hypothetical protein [Cyanobacteria bacterium UBA11149]HCA95526.1 hypothetical protein [Cyanobacteria bacterium UBA9226]
MKKITVSHWKKAFTFIAAIFLSAIGVKTALATTTITKADKAEKTSLIPPLRNSEMEIAQACPTDSRHQSPRLYARVNIRMGTLNIRSSPNGRIIGSVPNRWQVIVLNRDKTGQWSRITSHVGDVSPFGFVSAPDFRDGWVATPYLKDLGKFCDKPMNLMRSEMNTLSEGNKILVHEDWVQMGDRISRSISAPR